MHLSSLILYGVTVYTLNEYFDHRYLTQDFCLKVFGVATAAIFPYIVIKQIAKLCESDKKIKER